MLLWLIGAVVGLGCAIGWVAVWLRVRRRAIDPAILNNLLTPKEQRLRNVWRVCYGIVFLIAVLVICAFPLIIDLPDGQGPLSYPTSLVLTAIALLMGLFWIPYHCTYRKMGTIYAGITVVLSGLQVLWVAYLWLLTSKGELPLLATAIQTVLQGAFVYLWLRMWNINRRVNREARNSMISGAIQSVGV